MIAEELTENTVIEIKKSALQICYDGWYAMRVSVLALLLNYWINMTGVLWDYND